MANQYLDWIIIQCYIYFQYSEDTVNCELFGDSRGTYLIRGDASP